MCALCGQSVLKSHLIIFIHSHFGLTIFFLKSWNHRVSWPGIRMQLQKGLTPLCYTFSLSWLGTYLHFFFSFWFACNHFLFLYAIMHCFMCVKRSFCFVLYFLYKRFFEQDYKKYYIKLIWWKSLCFCLVAYVFYPWLSRTFFDLWTCYLAYCSTFTTEWWLWKENQIS